MSTLLVRFNTEHGGGPLFWRVLVDGEERLCSEVDITVPCRTASHDLPGIGRKWSIQCESDDWNVDENNKMTIR